MALEKVVKIIVVLMLIATPAFAEITQQTVLDKIEINSDGSIGIRLTLLVNNGDTQISKAYHRTMINPGDDIDAQMQAVNDNLAAMGDQPVSSDDIQQIKDHSGVKWTPAVLTAYQAKVSLAASKLQAPGIEKKING